MKNWLDDNFENSIKDYEYTRKSVHNMNAVVDSKDFAEQGEEQIYQYLVGQMEIVVFGDYLKRFIYDNADIDIPFKEVANDVYKDILKESFEATKTPISFQPTTKKKSAIFNNWLTNDTVSRNTIFILGFGLGMEDTDVTDFLTKVIKEDDFEFLDPYESIYWHCFNLGLPCETAIRMKEKYNNLKPIDVVEETVWKEWMKNPKFYFKDSKNLQKHLEYIKYHELSGKNERLLMDTYLELYGKCREIIANLYNSSEKTGNYNKEWKADDIKPGDFEEILCAGIPKTKNGNLEKNSFSRLAKQFQSKRMTRQRISSILNGKQRIQRFDLITLLFFIYAETVEKEWPTERFLQFVDRANEILNRCNMMGIYPVNPYEAFVLMCLLTTYPMETYTAIWEQSYEK